VELSRGDLHSPADRDRQSFPKMDSFDNQIVLIRIMSKAGHLKMRLF